MKKIYTIFVCICLLAGFVACEKDKDFVLTKLMVQNETITPSYGSATIDCSFKADATISEAFVHYSLSSSFAKYDVAKMTEEKGKYAAQLMGLQDNTTYYIRYAVSNKYSSVVSEDVIEFQTLQCTVPTIVLDSIADVWDNRAKAHIHLTFDGGASVTDMGICWSKQANPTIEDIHKSTKDTVTVLDMTDLQENTQYYVRAYAVNKVGVSYSEEQEFTTYSLPEVRTEEVADIQVNSALLSATLVFDGNDTATIKGFCWSDKSEPTIEGDHIAIDTASAGYTYALTALLPETQYFVRAYAQNKVGIVYGEEVGFTTNKSVVLPSVTTTAITKITETSAVAGGNVTSDGGASVTERGVCIATIANPTVANTKITAGNGVGAFTCELTGLQEGTKYYVRAYAVNSKGTAYGEEVVFTTSVTGVPTVTTTQPSSITETTAVTGGNVTADGGASVSERGVVYSLSANPSIADLSSTIVRSGSGTGAFTCNLSNLQAGTTYYVRAYAINKKGTAYGDEVSFTTALPISLATVTTASITNITETTAKAGGSVTNDGNAAVTERGVCIATVSNPTTSNTKITAGSGTGSFTCNLTGLQANTTYYVRAYAVNSKGTAYGEQVSFTTSKTVVLPAVTTSTVTQITQTTAVAGGNVTADGNASVTERGVCIATVSNPTTSNTKITAGSGTGSFTCNLTGLQANTTYYVRAYATNEVGTAYGEEVSFTTQEQSSTPNNGTENGYAYVDLGLSVKWATMNVGASESEDYGDYFAWGEIEPKDYYDWSTYKWCNGSETTLTKYNTKSSNGTVDNKTQLDLSDDAARANWGGSWRMPTDAEWTELREQCTWTWTAQNGKNGYKVTSKTNGNSIFLPAAGYRDDSSLYDAGSYADYWSSSLDTDGPSSACGLYFDSGSVYRYNVNRYYGLSVRPVCQ